MLIFTWDSYFLKQLKSVMSSLFDRTSLSLSDYPHIHQIRVLLSISHKKPSILRCNVSFSYLDRVPRSFHYGGSFAILWGNVGDRFDPAPDDPSHFIIQPPFPSPPPPSLFLPPPSWYNKPSLGMFRMAQILQLGWVKSRSNIKSLNCF